MIAVAQLRSARPRRVVSGLTSQQLFLGIAVLLFVGSAALATVWCTRMSAMQEMPTPGGGTMSMAWMPAGHTWLDAATSFLGTWIVMMIAMMLPSLVSMLSRYRQAVGRTGETRLGPLTALVGVAYFCVWTVFGMVVFPLGAGLATLEMHHSALSRAVPTLAGAAVLIAGAIQFTGWKARHLACCRKEPEYGRALPADTATAWRQGLRFGLHCACCCLNLTAILLAIGVMDLRAMAAVTVAITAERVAPDGQRVARAVGAVAVCFGLFRIAHAAGLV
jgi:predicted metal-binding membrane protein